MRKAPGQYRDRELRDRYRLTGWRRVAATALLAYASSLAPAFGAWKTAAPEGFSLHYDTDIWAEQVPPAPPSLLTLRCIAPACPPGATVTFVRDGRPLTAPGFGAFGPGAATGAAVDLRVQSLTPGARILARRPVQPVTAGTTSGYRGIYDIEDRALAKTGAAVMLLRMGEATLEARMSAPRLAPGDIAAFDGLMAGFDVPK